MPTLTYFEGITIRMYFQQAEHNPPHVHAFYGSEAAAFRIDDGSLLDGFLPSKARNLVSAWIKQNRDALTSMWQTQEFTRLPPLA